MGLGMPWHTCGSQRAEFESWFWLSIVEVSLLFLSLCGIMYGSENMLTASEKLKVVDRMASEIMSLLCSKKCKLVIFVTEWPSRSLGISVNTA